jgi:hypothetical protein
MEAYNVYVPRSFGRWPAELEVAYDANLFEGCFLFDPCSNEEYSFVENCLERKLREKVYKRFVAGVSRRELALYSHLLFALNPATIETSGPAIMDLSSGCKSCRHGLVQVRKPLVDPKLSRRLDVMGFQFVPRFINIISKRAMKLLENAGATGVNFLPCLRTDRAYSDKEASFDDVSTRVVDEAEHFQVVWTGATAGQVGRRIIAKVCEECGAVREAYDDIVDGAATKIRPDRRSTDDFQEVQEITTSDGTTYHGRANPQYVSGRVLELLVSSEIKGIRTPYSTGRKVDYGVFATE